MNKIAQVKRVYRDESYEGHESDGFLADLIIYDTAGNKIGRESESFPVEIMGRIIRGPRTFEPACCLAYWYRIEKPRFPLSGCWITTQRGSTVLGYDIMLRKWGKYTKRKRAVVLAPIAPSRANYDPELEQRVRLMTAQNLRDIARSVAEPQTKAHLIAKAEELEKGTDI